MKLPYVQHSGPAERHEQNLTRTILGLHHFGYMRYAELARLVWPMSPEASRQASASRFFKQLCERNLIHRCINSIGSYSYVLTGKGAREVRKLLSSPAFDGTRISGVQGVEVYHRTLGTAWLVEQLIAGHEVLSEYAINSLPGEITRPKLNSHWGKLPDGLVLREVRDEGGRLLHYNVDWLEVESSYKNVAHRDRLMDIAWSLGKARSGCSATRLSAGNGRKKSRLSAADACSQASYRPGTARRVLSGYRGSCSGEAADHEQPFIRNLGL